MRILLTILTLILVGCSSELEIQHIDKTQNNDPNAGRYSMESDSAPIKPISMQHIEDAKPRYEPYSFYGNEDYTLFGKHYTVIKDTTEFTQEGIASWYGSKFHGHKTSNGEIYNMYSMTAAHKRLPIPSYVRVLNKDNGKTAIVRINDRGPFHQSRIIDLSYAAASKLGVLKTGTANVTIESINIEKPTDEKQLHASDPNQYYIQMAATKSKNKVKDKVKKLETTFNYPINISHKDSMYRIRFGPFLSRGEAKSLLLEAKKSGYESAFIILEKK